MNFASYASFPHLSKGRKYDLFSVDIRDCFQRDRDRIIHSVAFRKLEYKTQVFVNYEGDYYRTRLTHSLEVAQIARSIARAMHVNEDLTEGIALAHDLGHPPFGHVGEDALQSVTQDLIKFEHNVQTIRILIDIEKRYHGFNGLNLSWELLEGLAKHNGPVNSPGVLMKKYDAEYGLGLNLFASAEAQIAAVSDDIAYNAHDMDDGVKSQIISIKQLETVSIMNKLFFEIRRDFSGIDDSLLLKESLRRLIAIFIKDVLHESEVNVRELKIKSADDVRNASARVVQLSSELEKISNEIKVFLSKNLYNDYRVLRSRNKCKCIVTDLFDVFYSDPATLPTEWAMLVDAVNNLEKTVIVCDFISGMTDRFAVKEHQRLFDTYSLLKSNYPY